MPSRHNSERNNMKIFENFKHFITQIKTLAQLTQKLQTQQKNLSTQLSDAQKIADDIQVDIDNMNLKNKPHLENIEVTKQHLLTELSKFKA